MSLSHAAYRHRNAEAADWLVRQERSVAALRLATIANPEGRGRSARQRCVEDDRDGVHKHVNAVPAHAIQLNASAFRESLVRQFSDGKTKRPAR
jgi:hypothetical protein